MVTALMALNLSPLTGAGPVSGTNFAFCSYGKFQLGNEMKKVPHFKFIPVTGLEYSYWKFSSPGCEISVGKTEILVTGLVRFLQGSYSFYLVKFHDFP